MEQCMWVVFFEDQNNASPLPPGSDFITTEDHINITTQDTDPLITESGA